MDSLLPLVMPYVPSVGGAMLPVLIVAVLAILIGFASQIRRLLAIFAVLAGFGMTIVAHVFWRLAKPVADRVLRLIPADQLLPALVEWVAAGGRPLPRSRWAQRLLAPVVWMLPASKSPLVSGDRRGAAEQIWPPAEYPALYADVRDDLRLPLWQDGKLWGGYEPVHLADRHCTQALVRHAVRGAVPATLSILLALLVVVILQALVGIAAESWSMMHSINTQVVLEAWPGEQPRMLGIGARAAIWGALFGRIAVDVLVLSPANLALAAVLLAPGALMLISLGSVREQLAALVEPYSLPTKDAKARWANRAEYRSMVKRTYEKQIELTNTWLKDAPLIELGEAMGVIRTRGDLMAPMPGQRAALDAAEALFQHVCVLGSTGTGKSRLVFKPLLAKALQLVVYKVNDRERRFGAYVTDAKGVLWKDVAAVAKDIGRENEIRVIGTKPGQWGVDLLDGLPAGQLATILRTVLGQIAGQSKDSFWHDMAIQIITQVAIVGEAYEQTPRGVEDMDRALVRPYSLWWIYQHASDDERLKEICHYLRDQIAENYREVGYLIDSLELRQAIDYLLGPWMVMASATKSGIQANITNLLGDFNGVPALRDRFATGGAEEIITIGDALENGLLVCNSVSVAEDGKPGRVVSIMLNALLFRAARIREQRFGSAHCWARPCLMVIDEAQLLATNDPSGSGLDTCNFANIARSTGIAMVIATQGIAALVSALGKEVTENFILQFRNTILLSCEDVETLEYVKKLAGQFYRTPVHEDGHRESLEQRVLLDRWNPMSWPDDMPLAEVKPDSLKRMVEGMVDPASVQLVKGRMKGTHSADMRFIPQDVLWSGGAMQNNQNAVLSAQQAAYWRSEDQEKQYRTQGNEMRPAVDVADFAAMGRGVAYCYWQLAGGTKQDFIILDEYEG